MTEIGQRVFNIITYGIAAAGIAIDFESIKSLALFTAGMILLLLQIILYIIKINKERKGGKSE